MHDSRSRNWRRRATVRFRCRRQNWSRKRHHARWGLLEGTECIATNVLVYLISCMSLSHAFSAWELERNKNIWMHTQNDKLAFCSYLRWTRHPFFVSQLIASTCKGCNQTKSSWSISRSNTWKCPNPKTLTTKGKKYVLRILPREGSISRGVAVPQYRSRFRSMAIFVVFVIIFRFSRKIVEQSWNFCKAGICCSRPVQHAYGSLVQYAMRYCSVQHALNTI